ncbi:MAG: T9SS type A sorting domain-containing protein [Bacteroidetes bacterium]|nr:T9SS type A sorting domain-containing protein [Bacteroidota bacterium]
MNSESITYTNNNYYGMYSVRVQNRIAGQYEPNECYKLKYWTSQNRLMDPNTNAVNEMNISLFPNPNNGHFVVNYTALVTKNTTVNIFDIYGKLVNSTDFTLNEGQNTLELNLDNLSNGIYFLSATDEPLQRQKFIISK